MLLIVMNFLYWRVPNINNDLIFKVIVEKLLILSYSIPYF
jgi:hypothetical protein